METQKGKRALWMLLIFLYALLLLSMAEQGVDPIIWMFFIAGTGVALLWKLLPLVYRNEKEVSNDEV